MKFINCSGSDLDDFITANNNTQFNNCVLENNGALSNFIHCSDDTFVFKNTQFYGGNFDRGVITINRAGLIVENCTFENISSISSPAILFKGHNLTIKRSKFMNLNALLSGGAIIGKFFPSLEGGLSSPFLIEDCEFVNLTSTGDGGAIFFDMDSGSGFVLQNMSIVNSNFTNCKSKYGGAICNLGGILNVVNTTFTNNSATFEGGAVYTSWCNLNIVSSSISDSTAQKNAGAIYFDKGRLTISQSNMTNSKIIEESGNVGRAIYAYDAVLDFSDSTFDNGGTGVYAVFTTVSRMDVNKNKDVFSLDNKNYIVSVENKGIHIDFKNNAIIVDKLPSMFNSTMWGWTTPDKHQGDNFDC